MKNHKLLSQIDDSILEDIIAKCESKMVSPGEGSPFKKKGAEAEVEDEELDLEAEDTSKSDMADKLSELDEEEILELYSKLQESKE